MGLFNLFGSKQKEDLLELQRLVLVDSPNKLIMSEKQLKATAAQTAARDLEIIQDCLRLIENTTNPDTFFSRLSLLAEKADRLRSFEKYIKFSGASPSAAYGEYWEKRQECIKQFLFRCYSDACHKAESAKTAKGKISKFQKYMDTLQPYYDQMDDANISFIKTRFMASIQRLQA